MNVNEIKRINVEIGTAYNSFFRLDIWMAKLHNHNIFPLSWIIVCFAWLFYNIWIYFDSLDINYNVPIKKILIPPT